VFLHPLAGVLSAYGMGLAEVRQFQESVVELVLPQQGESEHDENFQAIFSGLIDKALFEVKQQCPTITDKDITLYCRAQIRYQGTDATLLCDWPLEVAAGGGAVAAQASSAATSVHHDFADRHKTQFGFLMGDKKLIVESVSVEAVAPQGDLSKLEKFMPDAPAGHGKQEREREMYKHIHVSLYVHWLCFDFALLILLFLYIITPSYILFSLFFN
jgi:5-oxoprolinase (ATP-hydrolysing)